MARCSEREFARAGQAFDRGFAVHRRAVRGQAFLVDQRDGATRARVARAAPLLMGMHTSRDITRPASVNRPVGAAQEIDVSRMFHGELGMAEEGVEGRRGQKRAKKAERAARLLCLPRLLPPSVPSMSSTPSAALFALSCLLCLLMPSASLDGSGWESNPPKPFQRLPAVLKTVEPTGTQPPPGLCVVTLCEAKGLTRNNVGCFAPLSMTWFVGECITHECFCQLKIKTRDVRNVA